jgi:hypothetical protein
MKPSRYRIEENAAYKLSRHQLSYDRHRQHYAHEKGTHGHERYDRGEESRRSTDTAFRAAHLVQLVGILTPVGVSYFTKDPEKQWRAVRLASLITAVLTGGIWEAHHHKRKYEKDHGDWVGRVCDEMGQDGQGFTPGM